MGSLRDRFSFGELVHDGQIQSYAARDRRSQTTVLIHLIGFPGSELEQFLGSFNDSYQRPRAPVLEVGREGGTLYAITHNRPELKDFTAWLRSGGTDPECLAGDPLLKHRTWKLPRVDSQPASATASPEPESTSAAVPAAGREADLNASGIFSAPLVPVMQAPGPPTPAAPPPAETNASGQPGEFTRIFSGAGTADSAPPTIRVDLNQVVRSSLYAASTAKNAPDPSLAPPGESIGPKPASDPTMETSSSPAAVPTGEPGEFTRLFQVSSQPSQPTTEGARRSATGVFEVPPVAAAESGSADQVKLHSSESAAEDLDRRPVESPASSMPLRSAGPSEFTQLFESPASRPYSPRASEASVPTRLFEVARDAVRATELKTPVPLQATQADDATNLFNVALRPSPAFTGPPEKAAPYLGAPVFGGGTLQSHADVTLPAPTSAEASARPANLGLFPETHGAAYGATRGFQTGARYSHPGPIGESEYSMVVRSSFEKPEDVPAKPDAAAVPAERQTYLHLVLTLVLLGLAAIALVLFVALRR